MLDTHTELRHLPASNGPAIDFLTPQQVAERVQLSYKTVLAAIRRGELRAYRRGGKIRIEPSDYETWARSSPVQPLRAPTPALPTLRTPLRHPVGRGSAQALLAIGPHVAAIEEREAERRSRVEAARVKLRAKGLPRSDLDSSLRSRQRQ